MRNISKRRTPVITTGLTCTGKSITGASLFTGTYEASWDVGAGS